MHWALLSWYLFALVVHQGPIPTSGHYWSYRKIEGQWFYYNDYRAVKTTFNSIQNTINTKEDNSKRSGYLLFYTRNIDIDNMDTDEDNKGTDDEEIHIENNLNANATVRNAKLRTLEKYEQEIYNSIIHYGKVKEADILARSELENVEITGKDLLTLDEDEWLNDSVINFYIGLLQKRNVEKYQLNGNHPKVLFLNTNFYTKLCKNINGYKYENVNKWTKSVKLRKKGWKDIKHIFEFDKLIIPIHVGLVHWCCGCINFNDKSFEYYDSISNYGGSHDYFKYMRQYLEDEYIDKKISEITDLELDLTEWINESQNDLWMYQGDDASYQQFSRDICTRLHGLRIFEGCTIQIDDGNYQIQKVTETKCVLRDPIRNVTRNVLTYPQQIQDDCGVFTIKCAEWLSDGMYPDFSEEDMIYFRKRILTDIIIGRIQE